MKNLTIIRLLKIIKSKKYLAKIVRRIRSYMNAAFIGIIALKKMKLSSFSNENYYWIIAFLKLSLVSSSALKLVNHFYHDDPVLINKSKFENLNNNDAIVICVVKNDLIKMKKFYDHYRKLGVKKYVILDNHSTDGTFEWLKEQNNTDLFTVDYKYSTIRKQAWINRAISHYGFSRWYLVVDSDELFVYENLEGNSLQDLLDYAREREIDLIRVLMVDMYPEKPMLEIDDEHYITECVYFDTNNYQILNREKRFRCIRGGMRKRVFGSDNEQFNPCLTKHPFVYFQHGDIYFNPHYMFPFDRHKNAPCWGALLHYKFIHADFEKYRLIASVGNYYNSSSEYKQYIKVLNDNPNITFNFEDSIKYIDSGSLRYLTEIERIGW